MAKRSWAKRYAQAVHEICDAQESVSTDEALDNWSEDLRVIVDALSNVELREFLEHAKVPLDKKVSTIGEILPGIGELARNLVAVMVSRGLLDEIEKVESEYGKLIDQRRGLERVDVYSAVPLDDGDEERIARFVRDMTERDVILNTEVDPSIIGGLIIRIGDKLLDGSTKSKLDHLRGNLEGTSVR